MHGDGHIDCADAYVEYANALFEKVKSEGDPFGSAGPKPEAKPAPAGEGEAGPSAGTGGDSAAGDEATGEGDGGGDQEEGGDDDAEEGEGEAGDEADDLELAFQCFEVARLAYEKKPGAELPLADVLERLGEVHMENEQWASAVSEFESALSIKEKVLPAGDRQLAHLHFMMARASEAHADDLSREPDDADRGGDPAEGSSSSAMTPEASKVAAAAQRDQARSHYEACAEVLELRLQQLAQSAAPAADAASPSESDELRASLAEVREKVSELSRPPEAASAAAAAAAAGAAAGTATAAAASDGGSATTTSGFDAPRCGISAAGVTTVGFGAGASAGGGATTTVGFGGSAAAGKASAAPVQIIAGRKKAVLVPLSTNKSEAAATAAASTKAAREAEPAEGAEAKKARLQ